MNEQEVDGNSTTLADLPPHLIENILSYCFRDRFVLKQVCKAFYDAIWKVFGGNFWLIIDMDNDEHRTMVSDILNGSIAGCHPVRFTNVRMSIIRLSTDFELILQLFKARGEFVKNFEIEFWLTPTNELQQILALTKNLRKLSIDYKELDQELDLSELLNMSEIEIWSRSSKNCLRDVKLPKACIKTIKLTISGGMNEDELCEFLTNQNFITTMQLEFVNFESSIMSSEPFYRKLKLEKRFLIAQSNLRVLKIRGNPFTNDHEVIDLITSNLCELEELELDFNRIRPKCFDKLVRLRKLKDLKIISKSVNSLLAGASNFDIPTLSISCRSNVTAKIIDQITQKFSKLEKLRIKIVEDDPRSMDGMRFPFNCFRVYEFSLPKFQCESLKVLSIDYLNARDLSILKAFPNLMELSLFLESQGRAFLKIEIEGIFRDFPKLREISLRFKNNHQTDFDIIALINGNPKLKLIHLDNVVVDPETIMLNKLKRHFEITKIGYRVNRYSFLFVTDANVLMKGQLRIKDIEEVRESIRSENIRDVLNCLKKEVPKRKVLRKARLIR